MEKLEWVG